ncbi:hypothetical protein AL713_10820 [Clostridium botulinum]|nr:hypothetical protein [Clostridium botulinum]OPD31052.1 hypothetical protein AL713_10820 [Clostridium botulinum]
MANQINASYFQLRSNNLGDITTCTSYFLTGTIKLMDNIKKAIIFAVFPFLIGTIKYTVKAWVKRNKTKFYFLIGTIKLNMLGK